MKIAIASGKGGTGKTTIATNLAVTFSLQKQPVELLDCDVEEPNCHIFLKPEIEVSNKFGVTVPQVNREKCTYCGTCSEVCQYSAIVCLKDNVLVFPEMCHGCGGCLRFCPAHAITEGIREIGRVEKGRTRGFHFVQGRLNVGEVLVPPLIKAVKDAHNPQAITIIDAPPGTSCPVIEAVKNTDFVILVTEPTPFGLHDLKLALDMVRALDLNFAVAINRSDIGDQKLKKYCTDQGIEIVLEIPHNRRIAEAYSRGEIICENLKDYTQLFSGLARRLMTLKNAPLVY